MFCVQWFMLSELKKLRIFKDPERWLAYASELFLSIRKIRKMSTEYALNGWSSKLFFGVEKTESTPYLPLDEGKMQKQAIYTP